MEIDANETWRVGPSSVTGVGHQCDQKKLQNVYKSCPKMILLE